MAFANMLTRRMLSSTPTLQAIQKVAVIGAGVMGSGVAQVVAQAGYEVQLTDRDGKLQKAKAGIEKNLTKIALKKFPDDSKAQEQYLSTILPNLHTTTDNLEASSKVDLVIEAITENLAEKKLLFPELDGVAQPDTIFASNTSSFSIAEMANTTKRPEKFGGLHFFNPVPIMKLVEVVRTPATSPETHSALVEFGQKLGKTTVDAKDTPGFIVNKLLVPYLCEGLRMLDRSDASAKDIDVAMKLGCGYPMGPIELSDYIGLDTIKFILDGWHELEPNHPLYVPINILNKMVVEDKLGRKTGEGFFNYKK